MNCSYWYLDPKKKKHFHFYWINLKKYINPRSILSLAITLTGQLMKFCVIELKNHLPAYPLDDLRFLETKDRDSSRLKREFEIFFLGILILVVREHIQFLKVPLLLFLFLFFILREWAWGLGLVVVITIILVGKRNYTKDFIFILFWIWTIERQ